jgi:hypothetical protein
VSVFRLHLGDGYADITRFSEAVKVKEKDVNLARDTVRERFAVKVQKSLVIYIQKGTFGNSKGKIRKNSYEFCRLMEILEKSIRFGIKLDSYINDVYNCGFI